LEAVDSDGRKAIHIAACGGQLLQTESGENEKSDVHRSLLGTSSAGLLQVNTHTKDHGDVLKLLLEQRVSVESKDKFGYRPLHMAILKGQCGLTRLLLRHNAELEASP